MGTRTCKAVRELVFRIHKELFIIQEQKDKSPKF